MMKIGIRYIFIRHSMDPTLDPLILVCPKAWTRLNCAENILETANASVVSTDFDWEKIKVPTNEKRTTKCITKTNFEWTISVNNKLVMSNKNILIFKKPFNTIWRVANRYVIKANSAISKLTPKPCR